MQFLKNNVTFLSQNYLYIYANLAAQFKLELHSGCVVCTGCIYLVSLNIAIVN